MTLEEELNMIKKAKKSVAELDLKKRKIFDDLVQEIDDFINGDWDY